MCVLKRIDMYPLRVQDHRKDKIYEVESPWEHMIKTIECDISSLDIDEFLNEDRTVQDWVNNMPDKKVVPEIWAYKDEIEKHCSHKLDSEFQLIRATIPQGQILFHAGPWDTPEDEIIPNKKISTSLDPGLANINYRTGDVYLVIEIASEDIKFYFFDPKVQDGNHEAEVLLEEGIKLVKKTSYSAKPWFRHNEDAYNMVYYVEAHKIKQ